MQKISNDNIKKSLLWKNVSNMTDTLNYDNLAWVNWTLHMILH